MRLIKIGLGNVNTTVGALRSNTDKVLELAREMAKAKCTVGCFPELVINGYPPEDLVQWSGFVERGLAEVTRFCEVTQDLPTVFILGAVVPMKNHLYNCAFVIRQGEIIGIVPKEKLPTYNVFYEGRTFSAGSPGLFEKVRRVPFGDLIFKFHFGALAVEVCEDIWVPDGPMRRRCYSGAELVVNISASPFRSGVQETRREMIATRAADNVAAVVYLNALGGNDGLVFDGGGFVNQGGRTVLEAERYREGLTACVIDLDRTDRERKENTTWRTGAKDFLANDPPVVALECKGLGADDHLPYPTPQLRNFFMPDDSEKRREYFDGLEAAMIQGLASYFEKTGAFKCIGIALSGGRDSVLTLVAAWIYAQRKFADLDAEAKARAIKNFIFCFSMPSRYNSKATRSAARGICKELGVSFNETNIAREMRVAEASLREMLGAGQEPSALTLQNLQARIRGERMWNFANTAGALWLQTGNMSEKAVGYTTIGGDMMGGYSLIGNLPKTVVIELLRHLGEKYSIASVKKSLVIPSSAELATSQTDEAELMPFEVLDACIYLFVGEKMMPTEVYKVLGSMFGERYAAPELKAWVKKFTLFFRKSIFKWVQAPQAVHLGSLELDRERALQLPVVQSDEWLGLDELDKLP
ncbi:MAG: NAD(+) synthase [Candidatus Niyogibacteria bacterium]|nr:NAD(+) synthase [Candidatus Niyogibacteria bacterium]